MAKNTAPEPYDEGGGQDGPASQEETLLNEAELLQGLLDLAGTKDDPGSHRRMRIWRGGALKIEFRVRPLSEDEQMACIRGASKYAPAKPGQPKRALDTDRALYRSLLIYTATVDEDRAKLWDSKRAQEAYGVLRAADMVDMALLAGEKDRVVDAIEEISGYAGEAEGLAGN